MPEIQHLITGFHVNTDQGRLGFSTVVLIRGEQNILVDVGHKGRSNMLRDSLIAAGLSEQEIHGVILTHAHWDHCQNTDMFPQAKVMIHPRELEYATSPKRSDLATARYFQATLQGHEVEEVVEGAEIEAGIRILETPGHTAGHISVIVDTLQGPVVVSGDALPMAQSIFTGMPSIVFADETDAAQSIKRLVSVSNTVYPGHDRPFRIGRARSITYIGGARTIRLFGALGHGTGNFSVTVAPEALAQVNIVR